MHTTAYELRISDWSSPCALPIFQRDLALHQLLLEELPERDETVLAGRLELDLRLGEIALGVGALEVVAGGDLTGGLLHRVADLLLDDLGDDVKAGHGAPCYLPAHGVIARRSPGPAIIVAPGSVPALPNVPSCYPAGIP